VGTPVVTRGRVRAYARTKVTPISTPGSSTVVKNPTTVVKSIGGPQGPPGTPGTADVCSAPVLEAVEIGQPLYTDPLGAGVGLANSATLPNACFAGIAVSAATPGFAVSYRTSGCFALTTAQWDAVTGEVGGLTPAATYFLDPVSGMLTRTPTDAGFLVQVGRALSATEFAIEGDGPIPL